ncbi:uncharacterized protein BCN122_I1098 [Burkholderia cenocepacia]|nr:uncharacterized protein BCN122_I1098 [Burkholderia cenocepacia]
MASTTFRNIDERADADGHRARVVNRPRGGARRPYRCPATPGKERSA